MRIHPELPIYFLDTLTLPVLYTPGTLAVVELTHAEMIRQAWQHSTSLPDDPRIQRQMQWLADHARQAVAARALWLHEEFTPECLTVYLSNRCNLSCSYCFAADARSKSSPSPDDSFPLIDDDSFTAAAVLVARNCRRKQKPFQLVLHGGGEPTLHWDLLQDLVCSSKAVASDHGIAWSGYIATNGVLPPERARWLGATFDRIGLSCDGPPDIQDNQRPLAGQGPTSAWVLRSAEVMRKEGAQLEIRATITPATVDRQQEIIDYLVRKLDVKTVRFEPEYRLDGKDRIPQNPEHWAQCFLEARRAAAALGTELSFSGIRLDEHHGPYCNTLRQTLHLTPDGWITACFLCVDGENPAYSNRIIGLFDREENRFILDDDRITELRRHGAAITGACRDCFAAYHCARSCPELCSINHAISPDDAEQSFRCRLNRAIGFGLIEEAAHDLINEKQPPMYYTTPAAMEAILAAVPSEIAHAVINDWHAIRGHYLIEERGLPPPLWQERGFQYDGERAWQEISTIIDNSAPDPMSIYVHIPFCDKRCGFCDCYALAALPSHRLPKQYIRHLVREIEQWSALPRLSARPVTTIHFGGGTPNSLAPQDFAGVATALADHFNTTQTTEWALETTASLMTERQLAHLWEMRFRRLHIGVQTLEEPLRQTIGRRETTQTILNRAQTCLDHGFITTVDLLYGLPGQTVEGFFKGINQLIAMGVHGISFYRFNRSGRNQRFVRSHAIHEPDAFRDYTMFMAADRIMVKAGYLKNHFCHYALAEDRNLYYTHARRGEDLLALGASADGVFNGLHYRCPNLKGSSLRSGIRHPLLQGGVMETEADGQLSPVFAQLMTGSLEMDVAIRVGLRTRLEHWLSCHLLKEDGAEENLLRLTGNGSWFICSMLQEITV
jgi:radical SAM protein with 4Fe4S-binding SPASM domain